MTIEIKRVTSAAAPIFDRVAEDVFDEPVDPERLTAYLADPRHYMFVAIREGEVVGQVAAVSYAHPDKPPELFIDEVGVTPALQRQGIARRLLKEMLALGKSLGCEAAWLGTEIDNVPARGLYESFGVKPEQFVMYTFKL